MSRVENLDQIIETYGPHLHDAPYDGWRADRVIDKVVPTHCPYCAVQCGMNLLVEQDHVVGFEPRYDFPVNEAGSVRKESRRIFRCIILIACCTR
jgi:assimilatory nitrate reductase catalytic subunit